MDLLTIAGYAGALLIGLSLGLIGGGGSILTVPILVYLLEVDPVQATAYSLFVVGLTSLFGSWSYFRKQLLDYRTAAVFAFPALLAVFFTRQYLMPAIPETLFTISSFKLNKDMLLMIIFAILMVATSISIIRQKTPETSNEEAQSRFNVPLILLEGAVVGLLTGIVGAGGGFLIIPALVLVGRLPMKRAVGTSLLIIAIKSLVGFLGDLGNAYELEWHLLLPFSAIAVAGIYGGSFLSNHIAGNKLKPAFGWFVLLMAAYIMIREAMKGVF